MESKEQALPVSAAPPDAPSTPAPPTIPLATATPVPSSPTESQKFELERRKTRLTIWSMCTTVALGLSVLAAGHLIGRGSRNAEEQRKANEEEIRHIQLVAESLVSADLRKRTMGFELLCYLYRRDKPRITEELSQRFRIYGANLEAKGKAHLQRNAIAPGLLKEFEEDRERLEWIIVDKTCEPPAARVDAAERNPSSIDSVKEPPTLSVKPPPYLLRVYFQAFGETQKNIALADIEQLKRESSDYLPSWKVALLGVEDVTGKVKPTAIKANLLLFYREEDRQFAPNLAKLLGRRIPNLLVEYRRGFEDRVSLGHFEIWYKKE